MGWMKFVTVMCWVAASPIWFWYDEPTLGFLYISIGIMYLAIPETNKGG